MTIKKLIILPIFTVLTFGASAGVDDINLNERENDSVKQKKWNHYKLEKNETSREITFKLYNLSDDADLYVNYGDLADKNKSSYICRSNKSKTNDDVCALVVPQFKDVYIGVYGYKAAKYSLIALSKDSSCPTRFFDSFNDKDIYIQNWKESEGKMPSEYNSNNSGWFSPSYVDLLKNKGVVEFEYQKFKSDVYVNDDGTETYGVEVLGGQIATARNDFYHGVYTFRAKLPNTYQGLEGNQGFVFGMFVYSYNKHADAVSEIDIEYVYRSQYETANNQTKLYGVTHRSTGSNTISQLPPLSFSIPSSCIGKFCDYSFIWTKEEIVWRVNGKYKGRLTGADIPLYPGSIMINLWSGSPHWGGEHYLTDKKIYAEVDYVNYSPICD